MRRPSLLLLAVAAPMALALVACSAGDREPPAPNAIGTLLFDPPIAAILDPSAPPPDVEKRQEDFVATETALLRSPALARRVVDRYHLGSDAALGDDPVEAIRRAVTVNRRRDSGLVEVRVALDDRARAVTLCNQVLDTYLELRLEGDQPERRAALPGDVDRVRATEMERMMRASEATSAVRVVDRCAPVIHFHRLELR